MNLKALLPYESFVLTSALSAEEVHKRIFENVEPKKSGFLFAPLRHSVKPYAGQIWNGSFTISRVINYRNSFQPVITGQIISVARTTQIKIQMRMDLIIRAFVSVWLGMAD